jgi:hypothetical protein
MLPNDWRELTWRDVVRRLENDRRTQREVTLDRSFVGSDVTTAHFGPPG